MFAYFFLKTSKETDHWNLQVFILDHHWKISRFRSDLQVLHKLVESVQARVRAVIKAWGGDIRKFMCIFHNCWAVIVICNESNKKISTSFKTKAKQKYLDWRSLLDSTVQCFSTRGGIYFKIVSWDNIWGCAGYYDVVVITKCGIFLARFITGIR